MVYGFVNQSEGHVKITSEVGRGTTVRLYLPSAGDVRPGSVEPPDPTLSGTVADLPGGVETILVVEDTDGVREVVVADLRRLGYGVSAAPDGAAALGLIEHGLDPDLLLTDVELPDGIDGVQLAGQMLKRLPGMKVLFMSGYVEDLAAYRSDLDPNFNLLRKPFSRTELAIRVRARLDEGRQLPEQSSSAA
jgi:CheY-like chemotaxis protein